MNKLSRRLVEVAAVVVAVLAASLVAGVGASRATTSFNPVLSQYSTTGGNTILQVSYGGLIGYHLDVTNNGDSNTTHVQIIVKSDVATFKDASDTSCTAAPGNPNWMVCIPFGGTFNAGLTYSVDFRFTAPLSGPATAVTTTPYVVVAAQSVGGSKNNGTILATGNQVTTQLVAGTDTTNTFLRGNEKASAAGPQNFGITQPGSFLGSPPPFAVAVGIHNQTAATPPCATCLSTFTTLTIPTANLVSNPKNPFYQGTSFAPYGWTMSASYPSGFQLKNGVWHLDDTGHFEFIPPCATLTGNAPTTAEPVCWDTLQQVNNKKIVQATGRGLENGSGGFG